MPGVVKRRLRHVIRFSSVFSMPFASSRVPIVPVDSSHAKRPLPFIVIFVAVSRSSAAYWPSYTGAAPGAAIVIGAERVTTAGRLPPIASERERVAR